MSDNEEPITNIQQQTASQVKSGQNIQIKKLNSYTYWVDEKNKSRQLPPEQRPQKVQPPKLINQASKSSQNGKSEWNTAGTWQHKTISLTQVQKQYKQKLNQWTMNNLPQAKLKSVSLNGQCQLVHTSRKTALTYEIHGTVQFQKKLQTQPQVEKPDIQSQTKDTTQQVSDDKLDKQDKQDKQDKSDKQEKGQDKSKITPKSSKSKSKSKPKPRTLTFEIVDLTDHGDRDYKSKADQADDRKFISQKSQQLLIILQNIIKSFK